MFRPAKKIITVLAFFAGVFFIYHSALAATPDVGLQFGDNLGLSSADPRIIAGRIIQIALGFLGLLAVSLTIYGGFLWMTASGNEEQIEKAKHTLTSAIIGLLIILSAFGIATFVLNSLLGAVGTNSGGSGGSGGGNAIDGSGAIGACIVESVYPTPNQTDVARNTSLIVTFKEDVDPAEICTTVDVNSRCQGSLIRTSNIKIYKSKDDPAIEGNLLSEIGVFNTDKKTFVFVPKTYLGSPSELIWYTVHLDWINSSDGFSIFESCQPHFLEWQFEVSNKIDLTPPYVLSGGVFPPPDNAADTYVSTPSVQAVGSITVNSQPKVYAEATSTSVVSQTGSPVATVMVEPDSTQKGSLTVLIDPANKSKATLLNGNILLGGANFNGKTVNFPDFLSLTVAGDVSEGNSWTIAVSAVRPAETLSVGSMIYTFVRANPQPNQIVSNSDNLITAQNIMMAINDTVPELSASVSGSRVSVTIRSAGAAGNNMVLGSDAAGLSIVAFSGGVSGSANTTAVPPGSPDQPRNSVIQINFNEAILPINVAGDAELESNAIHIVNADLTAKDANASCSAPSQCKSYKCESGSCQGDYLAGKFVVANQYKTVEFISDNECGVNGCGEKIYCLPEKSNLRAKVKAASLITCASDDDCAARTPYNFCENSICTNVAKNPRENFPQADFSSLDGTADLCFNSLDGNRNKNAEGPVSFFSQNSPLVVAGDNFSWSFFVSDKLDIAPPKINFTDPVRNNPVALPVGRSVKIAFSKIMMASTLKTGSTKVDNGQAEVNHKNVNLWSLSGNNVGYWIESSSTLSSSGIPVNTNASIKHGDFREAVSYRAQIGSGVRDIFQNCFKPSAGQACPSGISDSVPSCCNGEARAALGGDGNCQ